MTKSDPDIVYVPTCFFGVLFADVADARHFGQIARAVRDSKTWGQFKEALPRAVFEEIEERYENREEELPPPDAPFPGDFVYGEDGYFVGGWPGEAVSSWFPQDVADQYGCYVEYTSETDNFIVPREAADDIANALRARGFAVEKTLTGDLADWLDLVMGPWTWRSG